jgi:hypothetical protein
MDHWNRSSSKRKNCLLDWPEKTAAKKNCKLLFIAPIYVQNSGINYSALTSGQSDFPSKKAKLPLKGISAIYTGTAYSPIILTNTRLRRRPSNSP